MPDLEKQAASLNALREKSRFARFYLASALVLLIVLVIVLGLSYGIACASVVALLYQFVLRRDISAYREGYQIAILMNGAASYLDVPAYQKKSALSLDDVRRDGCLPINNTHGIVRLEILGKWRGQPVRLCDISYMYQMKDETKQRKAIPLSGCYIGIDLAKETGLKAVFCSKDILPLRELNAYYEKQGLVQCHSFPESDLICFADKQDTCFPKTLTQALSDTIKRFKGPIVLGINRSCVRMFLLRRFIAQPAPVDRHMITTVQLVADPLKELAEVLHIVSSVGIDQS